jgi:Ca2+-binding RTX toxin-like protein
MAVAPLADDVAGQAFPYFSTGTVTIDGVSYAGVEGLALFDPGIAASAQPGSYGFETFLHEIGHLLGLAHPFDGSFSAAVLPGVTSAFWDYGDFSLNQEVFTVMSYTPGFKEKDGPAFFGQSFGNAGSPMAFDVAAVQAMYGANTTTNAGNDAYLLPETNGIGTYYRTIWDTGGIDTISVTPADTAGALIDLRAASLQFDSIGGGAVSFVNDVRGGFTIANGVVIENATGAAGNDRLIGNDAANVLLGNDGTDRLAGSDGDDELHGGGGNDVLFGDAMPGEPSGIGMGNGHVTKSAGAGNFTFATAIDLTSNFSLAADPDIANAKTVPHVTVNATGDGHFDYYSLTLAAGTTITLDIDHTTGGLDAYFEIYSLAGASFFFNAAQDDNLMSAGAGGSSTNLDAFGTFTTRTSGTFIIGVYDIADPNFVMDAGQNYELNISVSATTEAIGSGAGDDLLDGGAGADTMTGGGGNDHYIIDNTGDVAIEVAGGGDADEVSASVNYSAAGQDIERIVLTGAAAIDATGQELDNIITGNAGANHISGGLGDDRLDGKDGADHLAGGPGDDVFVFSSALGAGNVDIVDDLLPQDRIELDNAVFAGLAEGPLSASAFKDLGHHGATVDASDRILYNSDTGDLFFDADGSGGGFSAILFANVGRHTSLGAADFTVI